MTVAATLLAVAATLAALGWLTATDPKRRRAFRLPEPGRPRRVRAALAAVFLPGLLLLGFGNGAGFAIWLGVVSVAGWGLAAMTPSAAARLGDRARRAAAGARAVAGLPGRVALLERRVAALEAELAKFGAGPGGAAREERLVPAGGPAQAEVREARRA